MRKYPPRREVDPVSLADVIIRQLRHYKAYIDLLFSRDERQPQPPGACFPAGGFSFATSPTMLLSGISQRWS
jgi:hypothetical protein